MSQYNTYVYISGKLYVVTQNNTDSHLCSKPTGWGSEETEGQNRKAARSTNHGRSQETGANAD